MKNRKVIFNSFPTKENINEIISSFNHVYSSVNKETDGKIICFTLDDNNRIVDFEVTGNNMQSIFYGPNNPCIWFSNGKDIFSEEHIKDIGYVRKIYRKTGKKKSVDSFLMSILSGIDVTDKLNYCTDAIGPEIDSLITYNGMKKSA